MNKNITYGAVTLIALLAIFTGLYFLDKTETTTLQSTKYDSFGICLTEKGATFYGAFWCQHCKEQKKKFENSAKIPYVECSTPDGNGQNAICKEKGVESYPTWIFADGTKLTGEVSLEILSQKTGCELPTEDLTENTQTN